MAPAERVRPDLDGIRSICVLCWGLIGDVLVRVATLEALKCRFPQARLTAVVDAPAREVLAHHPDCDEVFVFPRRKRPVWRYLAGTAANVLALRRRRFDLSVNLYSGGSSPCITRLINARLRLGFDHTPALRRANNLLAPHPSLCDNWYKAFGAVLLPLGVDPGRIRRGTSFYCTEAARERAVRLLMPHPRPLAGFNLGAGVPEKRWPVERFAALAGHARRRGFTPLVFTNPGMEDLAEAFERRCAADGAVVRLPRLTLDEVGAVMEHCACIVTGDTSLMHLAFGLKRPTLVLFTHTRPECVTPEDCVHVVCFVEDPRHRDECGRPLGTREIPLELAAARFDQLVALI